MSLCTAACCKISAQDAVTRMLQPAALAASGTGADVQSQTCWLLSGINVTLWSQACCTGWRPGTVLMSRMCPGAQCTTWSCMGFKSARLREYLTGLQLHAILESL
jgi:hypothetical protein